MLPEALALHGDLLSAEQHREGGLALLSPVLYGGQQGRFSQLQKKTEYRVLLLPLGFPGSHIQELMAYIKNTCAPAFPEAGRGLATQFWSA